MKKFLIIIIVSSISSELFSQQVGINSINPVSTLDVRVINQSSPENSAGIAVPQVDILPAGGNRAGQLVYLTSDNTYYFFNGASWQTIEGSQISLDSWQTPTLLNGWVNYDISFGDVGYYKDRERVYFRGMIKNGGSPGSIIFTLPIGYRPAARRLFDTISSGTQGRIDVDTDGNVIFMQGFNSWISLDGISFRVN